MLILQDYFKYFEIIININITIISVNISYNYNKIRFLILKQLTNYKYVGIGAVIITHLFRLI